MAKSKNTKSAGSGSKKAAKPRFNQKFLDEMRRKLLKERAKYLHSAEEYQAEAESLLATREPGDVQFDEEGGEGTTVAVERERDLALSSQARHTVSQIDAALERIENGTYGYCITSGAPIPIARLRAIPWAAERVEVKAGGLGRR
ncbi:MAG: TraR/DksA family transcriptional regulator [Acidimicrobiaceae bacterium]|nr:TraR/DksA family transcriptional regulator [Acidimicrobiaceae bacterium]MYE09198.1 TraR/DksA family transcriptional regulator [Acidimicrobiaceae bacterium]MYH94551.1 TraR/DksA family transcriptional regulator [Acidimicrobiaceae bacterium]MYI36707.1 TraR/DksA family transcriptional regulator [Acidimicrobiaceae bacterium]